MARVNVIDESEEREVFAAIGWIAAAVAAPLVLIGGVLFQGFILQLLWGWFVTPAFGLAVPPLAVCLGLSLLATMLIGNRSADDSPFWVTVARKFAGSLFFLGTGWLIHLFV